MSNLERGWCPRCGTYTNFYNVEIGVWECDDCGYEKDDYDAEEGDIEGEEDDFDDEDGDY